MEKRTLGDITFIIHNKRESIWFDNFRSEVETLTRYINDPSELKEYTASERVHIISVRLQRIHDELHSAFWLDIIKNHTSIYTENTFRKHFMFRR